MLIHDPVVRAEKTRNKYAKILSHLRDHTYASRKILSQLIDLSEASGFKTLEAMIKQGWVVKYKSPDLNFYLYGITTSGLLESWEYSSEQPASRATFQPSKLRPLMVRHYLIIQEAKLKAMNFGWSDWIPGKLSSKSLLKKPDALARNPSGQVINIEVELTIKSLKNYKIIVSKFLQDIKQGHYNEVHYLVESKKFARSLNRQITLIHSIPVNGRNIPLTESHKSRIKVFVFENWPNLI